MSCLVFPAWICFISGFPETLNDRTWIYSRIFLLYSVYACHGIIILPAMIKDTIISFTSETRYLGYFNSNASISKCLTKRHNDLTQYFLWVNILMGFLNGKYGYYIWPKAPSWAANLGYLKTIESHFEARKWTFRPTLTRI